MAAAQQAVMAALAADYEPLAVVAVALPLAVLDSHQFLANAALHVANRGRGYTALVQDFALQAVHLHGHCAVVRPDWAVLRDFAFARVGFHGQKWVQYIVELALVAAVAAQHFAVAHRHFRVNEVSHVAKQVLGAAARHTAVAAAALDLFLHCAGYDANEFAPRDFGDIHCWCHYYFVGLAR